MDFDPKNHAGLVASTARRVYRHPALRASLAFDDFEQEMWLVWTKAVKGYDASKGVAFTTYFFRACEKQALKMAAKELRRVRGESYDEADGGIADEAAPSTEELLDQARRRARVEAGDPRTALVLRLLDQGSEMLASEDEALRAKAEFARSQGFERNEAGVNLPALFRLIGVSRSQGYRMIGELKESIHGQDG